MPPLTREVKRIIEGVLGTHGPSSVLRGDVLADSSARLRPAILELGDIAPDPDIAARVREIAGRMPGVLGLDKCFVRKMGFSFYVDLHIIVNGELSVREGHRIAHLVKDSVLKELPQISEVLVHVEPEEELAAKGLTRVRHR